MSPLDVKCPHCGAEPGSHCIGRGPRFAQPYFYSHPSRLRAAEAPRRDPDGPSPSEQASFEDDGQDDDEESEIFDPDPVDPYLEGWRA